MRETVLTLSGADELTALLEQGLGCHRLGQIATAQAAYHRILEAEPGHARAWYLLGMTQAQVGEFGAATRSFHNALDAQPDYFDALHHLGGAYTEAGEWAAALPFLRRAIGLQPAHGGAHFALANALQASGQIDEAIAGFRRAVACQPQFAPAHNNLGNALTAQGDFAGAVESLRRAAALAPGEWQIHASLGAALHANGQLEESAQVCRRALALQPDNAALHANLAKALHLLGRTDEARRGLDRARTRRNSFVGSASVGSIGGVRKDAAQSGAHSAAQWLLAFGGAYQALCEFGSTADYYRQALAYVPDDADAHDRLGHVCWTRGELEEAEACFRRALHLKPDFIRARVHLSYILWAYDQLDEAQAHIQQALSLGTEDADAHCALGHIKLKRGDYAGGWPHYDHIHRLDLNTPRRFPQPRWNGSDLSGKTILIHAQFGIGDTLQFARYLPLVRARGGRVLFECPCELAPLLQNSAGFDEMLIRAPDCGSRIPDARFDAQFNLMSLAALFQSDDATIPAALPYVHVDAERRERWRPRINAIRTQYEKLNDAAPEDISADDILPNDVGAENSGTHNKRRVKNFVVGIVWAASTGGLRSCHPADFAPLAALPGVTLVSLQKGLGARQANELPVGMRLDDLAPEIGDFADTAAILSHLDLIITVDTSVAHLAGAMNLPVWTLLHCGSDWRWQTQRADSPWYPSMRLFRQARPGDWHSVFAQVTPALEQLLQQT